MLRFIQSLEASFDCIKIRIDNAEASHCIIAAVKSFVSLVSWELFPRPSVASACSREHHALRQQSIEEVCVVSPFFSEREVAELRLSIAIHNFESAHDCAFSSIDSDGV